MKTIIAEKPSVAKEIAHIVGADKREEGYMQGNGYYVTWAFGHLVQPAMPETYGMKGFHAENLPVIPDPFVLVPRQVKTENGYKPDAGVLAQIKIIGKLFDSSERIIVATDAGREGELIFRYLYAYLGCRKPFDRLWISSLTDTAIREGLLNLRDGKERMAHQSNFSTLCRGHIIPKEIKDKETVARFLDAVEQFARIINDSGYISLRKLTDDEITGTERTTGLVGKYLSLSTENVQCLEDMELSASGMRIGNKHLCLHTLSQTEDLPTEVSTDNRFERLSTDRSDCRLSFAAPVGLLLSCNHIYN